ncbi:MAG: hypothetical protein PHP04_08395 [Bacteroidales bacterium]|nr:hypothetical protein [Bacteroidales bacterium]
MNNLSNTKEILRRAYSKPKVERIRLDREISMVMDSVPPDPEKPVGNDGDTSSLPESHTDNPFKIYRV